ncbi:bcl2-associated agonist of cell death isoform X1 [Theropithecus gelada]|uniref:bcl2-associated agonist of cell death isoform X1 n=1 Tax=Theropithecus gelada TaxID=9565 RepID=UPI000DC15DDB|nr:bcl2-associated agonist of cell death isoform X1 [Theropithecus gelada]
MFQIPEFEPSEQEDSSSAERGLGPSPAGDKPSDSGKHHRQAPGLLWDASHQQEQPTSSSHHGGAGAVETRSRHSSYPAGTEEDEGMEEEPSPFRGRSRSAPPNLWAAQRYGRELRRMSDEFVDSFKVRTSSPEERGHSDADAAKLQLDASLPVLVGSELGQGKLRPLPVTFAPRPETPPALTVLVGHLGYGRKCFPQALCKRGSVLPLSVGGLTQIPFRCM